MAEIGSLRVSLGLNSADFDSGVTSAANSARRLQSSLGQLDRGARLSGGGLQNLGFQAQDLAVQLASGTSFTQALAQQLPQLLSGFGLAGVALGTLSAVVLPLAGHFLGAGDAAEEFENDLDALNEALARVKEYSDIAGASSLDLMERFGTAAAQARSLSGVLAEFARVDAIRALDSAVADLAETFGGFDREQQADFLGLGPTSEYEETLRNLQAGLGLTDAAARRLLDGFERLANAPTLGDKIAAAEDLNRTFIEVFGSVENIPSKLFETARAVALVAIQAADAKDELEEGRDAIYEMAQADLARVFREAQGPAARLVEIIEQGRGILDGWGSAVGSFVASFAPDADLARSLAGMTDGVAAASALLRERERFEPLAYNDGERDSNGNLVGPPVFRAGYGSDTITLSDGTIRDITEGMRVSQADAERDLQRRITTEFMPAAMAAVGEDVFAALSASQQAVLTSLAYNYGSGAFMDDLSGVAAAVREGSTAGVVAAIRALGDDNGGINRDRRNEEAALFGGAELAGIGEVEAANAAAAEVARERAEAEREAARVAEEAARATARELGLREDLLDASARAAQDAEFELSLVGKSAAEQARLRTQYTLTNQALANGIDLNEQIAGTTQTYGERIDEAAAAAGRAVGQQEALAAAQDQAADAAKRAAAEMQQFISSLTTRALGPITNNPIGGFLSSLPGFSSGAESVIGGFVNGGFGAAASALGTALSGATSGLAGFGTALGAIAAPIGAAIGLFNALKGTTEVLETGLGVAINGLDKISAWTWEVTETTRLWGLLKSKSSDIEEAPQAVVTALDKAFGDIAKGVMGTASALGIGADAFEKFRFSVLLDTEGMSDEQIQRELIERLQAASDRMARLAGVTGRMQQEGESATETLERLSTTLPAVNEAFGLLGFNLYETSLQGAAAAARIADVFGGLDAATQGLSFYFREFYSQSEQVSALSRQFASNVRALRVGSGIKDMDDFRRRVDALMAQGRDVAAAGLIALAPLFKGILDLKEEAKSARLDEREGLLRQLWELKGQEEKIRKAELKELDPSNRALQRRIWALEKEKALVEALAAASDDFASRFDFEQTLGRATADLGRGPDARDHETVKAIRALQDQSRQLGLRQDEFMETLASIVRKWDRIGMPAEQVA